MIVYGYGKTPNPYLLCGEAPGAEEAFNRPRPRPFVGPSGRAQDEYLSRYCANCGGFSYDHTLSSYPCRNFHPLSSQHFYLTNIVKTYIAGNPDPTQSLINEWTQHLLKEIDLCQPKFIIAVGRLAMRWFLGEEADLDSCHGLPHKAGAFDPSRANRAPKNCCIVPVIHPAAGFYDGDQKSYINYGYQQAARYYHLISTKQYAAIDYREDKFASREIYEDVTGDQLRDMIRFYSESSFVHDDERPTYISLDTEGYPNNPWSIQVTFTAGQGAVLRTSQKDFAVGITALQRYIDENDLLIATHDATTPGGCLYDTIMCRAMGLELSRARQFNTMYGLYLLRLFPKGLKPAAWRWCGMRMTDYPAKLNLIAKDKQIDYLQKILDHHWPKPEARLVYKAGDQKLYTPRAVDKTAESIIIDVMTGKETKEGPTDPFKRWKKVPRDLRKMVAKVLGPMPYATLDDIPLSEAITYAARDSDATYRLVPEIKKQHVLLDLTERMEKDCELLPVFEEIQRNGMPVDSQHFVSLSDEMFDNMCKTQALITNRYNKGKLFNPKSPVHVADLIKRRGLQSKVKKRTKTGQLSTAADSIKHLQFSDPAIELVFQHREFEHVKSSFCEPILELIEDRETTNNNSDINRADVNLTFLHCIVKPGSVTTRRLATENPNFLAMPSRSEIGLAVRKGFKFPEGYDEIFSSHDLSQIEARVMAHESQDELLCRLFRENRDIHKETASLIFGKSIDDLSSQERRAAKTINFGIIYGMMAHALSIQLHVLGILWGEDICERMISEYFKIYRGVAEYVRQVTQETKRLGYVRDQWGMYRYLPAIWDRNEYISAEAGRQAVSHRVQGGAQGMIQNSMLWLKPRIRKLQDAGHTINWRPQYHDELLFSFRERLWSIVDSLVMRALTKHSGWELTVPILAGGAKGKSWGDLKD